MEWQPRMMSHELRGLEAHLPDYPEETLLGDENLNYQKGVLPLPLYLRRQEEKEKIENQRQAELWTNTVAYPVVESLRGSSGANDSPLFPNLAGSNLQT
jgi:hypothetical protein